MSSFTDNLVVEKLAPRLWRTYRAFEYHIGALNSTNVIYVPEGFLTDFASIPRVFWIWLPPDGIYTQAAVLHDYLYNTKMFERKTCDKIFKEAMTILKVDKFNKYMIYKAVRWFGWIPWNKKR